MHEKKGVIGICASAILSIVLSMIVTVAAGHGVIPFGIMLFLSAFESSEWTLLVVWFLFSTLTAIFLIILGNVAITWFQDRKYFYITGRILIDLGIVMLAGVIVWFISRGEGKGKALGVITSMPFFIASGFAIFLRASPSNTDEQVKGFPVETDATINQNQNKR